MVVYVDESGDLGQYPGGSRHFLISFLIVQQEKAIHNHIKHTIAKVKHGFPSHLGYLHFHKEEERTRQLFFSKLGTIDFELGIILLDKANIDHIGDQSLLYRQLICELIEKLQLQNCHFVCSQRYTNKRINLAFQDTIVSSGSQNTVSVSKASSEKGLQFVDGLSWGVFKAMEFGDYSYYTYFQNRIKLLEFSYKRKAL